MKEIIGTTSKGADVVVLSTELLVVCTVVVVVFLICWMQLQFLAMKYLIFHTVSTKVTYLNVLCNFR
jgi:hypothetical protein